MAIARKVEEFTDISDDKRTGYFYQGKEIIAGKSRGPKPKYIRNPKFYAQYMKVDAATLYAVYGDVEQTAELAKVPVSVIRGWKQEPWWIEIQKQVYAEQNEKLAARISSVLDKTITHLEDRLENGDEILNVRTGEIVSKKVDASVLAKMFENMAHQRRVTRGEPTSISAKIGVQDRLGELEKAFLKFANAKELKDETEIREVPEEEEAEVIETSLEEEEFIEAPDEYIEPDEENQTSIKSEL